MKFRIAILSVLLPCFVNAQEFKNDIGIQLGVGGVARQDLIFSPFAQSSFTPLHIGLQYQRMNKFYHKVQIRYSGATISQADSYTYFDDGKEFQTAPHYLTLVDLNYDFGASVYKSDKSRMLFGFDFQVDVQALGYSYGRFGSFGYYSTFGLGAFLKYDYQLKEKHRIGAFVDLPIVYWIARSPYLVNDDEFIENTASHSGFKTFFAFIGDGKITSLNEVQSIDLGVNYSYHLSPRFDVGCSYLFEFIHASIARHLFSYRNTFFLTTHFKF